MLVDNTGWVDFGAYGGRTATPNIDRLAAEGMRFNNYTVEAQCTPTRSAIMTGRQPVRMGTFAVPLPGQGEYGMSPWEYTMAEMLSEAGYATAAFGKWHLGDVEGRLPVDQGFDEWWASRTPPTKPATRRTRCIGPLLKQPVSRHRRCGRVARAKALRPNGTSTCRCAGRYERVAACARSGCGRSVMGVRVNQLAIALPVPERALKATQLSTLGCV
jgi:arylsulfatase A-like enzyme